MKHIRKIVRRQGNRSVEVIKNQKMRNNVKLKSGVKIITETKKKMLPTINIITRTSGRPNGFKRCHQSILSQSYPNIRHIVSIDNLEDKEYVEKYNVDYYFIDKDKISKQPDIDDPKTGKRFIYNLYFNELISKVDDGWILILDDDDYLANSNVIQKMVNQISNNTDMIIWQMRYPNGSVLPSIPEMGKKPRLGRVGSPCMMVHSGIAKTIRWDGWKCGDYRFISKVWDKTQKKKWIREPLIQLGGAGFGMRKDIAQTHKKINTPKKMQNDKILSHFQRKYKNKIVEAKRVPQVDKGTSNVVINPNKKTFSGGISILITAFKTGNYIQQCLDSIEKQIYFKGNNKFEVIVGVDACMNTWKRLMQIKDKYRNLTCILMQKNVGTYVTMNTIIPLAKYENILRFDSDDIMKPNMIKKIMSVSSKYDIVRFKFTSFNNNIRNIIHGNSGHMPAVGSVFFKKRVFDMCGGYKRYRFSADSELLKRVKKFTKINILNDQLFFYRRHSNNLTTTVKSSARKAIDNKTRRTKYSRQNLKIKPVKGSIKLIRRGRNFNRELLFFTSKLIENEPFSLVRYGDGEMIVLENKAIDLSKKHHGEHKFVPTNPEYTKLKKELGESIKYKSKNLYIGLPCPCCVNKNNINKMINIANQDTYNLTWANIFVNSNFNNFNSKFIPALKNKKIVLVCHKNANIKNLTKEFDIIKDFRVGGNAWLNDYDKINDIVNFSKTVEPNTVFLFMAGTFTKLTIYKIHKQRQDLFLLDLGSTLDLEMELGATRNYLKGNHKNNKKICEWLRK